MLRETLSQTEPGGDTRRWFADDFFDLYVWTDRDSRVVRFQLCYGKPNAEHALTWSAEGTTHHQVDDGEGLPTRNLTPILLPDGAVAWDELRRRFLDAAAELDPSLRAFVASRLSETPLAREVASPSRISGSPPTREPAGEPPSPRATWRLAWIGGAVGAGVLLLLLLVAPGDGPPRSTRAERTPPPRPFIPNCSDRDLASDDDLGCFKNPAVRQYIDHVRNAMLRAWQIPTRVPPDQSFSLTVRFDVDGSVRCWARPASTDLELAQSVYSAIEGSQPFPAMPPSIECLASQPISILFRNPASR